MGQTAGLLHLKAFGGLSVASNGVPVSGAAQQRKTLALLALLAAAGRTGLSRDKLVAYMWPEADAEHARGLLKQACYALRRDLHQPDLILGATQLRLNPDVITSDVQAFEAALERGDAAQAAELYGGPFLDGFYLSDAAEFERWVEAERRRLRERARLAMRRCDWRRNRSRRRRVTRRERRPPRGSGSGGGEPRRSRRRPRYRPDRRAGCRRLCGRRRATSAGNPSKGRRSESTARARGHRSRRSWKRRSGKKPGYLYRSSMSMSLPL